MGKVEERPSLKTKLDLLYSIAVNSNSIVTNRTLVRMVFCIKNYIIGINFTVILLDKLRRKLKRTKKFLTTPFPLYF